MSSAVATPTEAGAGTFLDLADTPADYTAGALFLARINAGQTALEFVDPASVGATTFAALTDTPADYTAGAGFISRINPGQTGLEFLDPATDFLAQYSLLAGRAGGQNHVGGTAASEEITFRGTSNANLGRARFYSPIVMDNWSAATALQSYAFNDAGNWGTYTVAFVGGCVADNKIIEFTKRHFHL